MYPSWFFNLHGIYYCEVRDEVDFVLGLEYGKCSGRNVLWWVSSRWRCAVGVECGKSRRRGLHNWSGGLECDAAWIGMGHGAVRVLGCCNNVRYNWHH